MSQRQRPQKEPILVEPSKESMYPTRKAPVQVSFSAKEQMQRAKPNVGDANVYNIWYDRWYSEERKRSGLSDQVPFTRCNPEKDSGLTKADENSRDAYFCVFFAKGCCGKGYNCQYLHRLPRPEDEVRIERTRDIFGRERFREDKDDMGGHGSFERENRSLYIGRIGTYDDDVENVVRKHFGVFGNIEKIKILYAKAVAFVKYESRMSAEFAKEAMHEQSFDKGEILNVRWATEDPNPVAKEEFKLEAQTAVVQKLLENPHHPSTIAFLYETQEESDLTKYYQQDGLDYAQYYYSYTYPNASGNIVSPDLPLIYSSENAAADGIGTIPPPPPKYANKNSKRGTGDIERELEELANQVYTETKTDTTGPPAKKALLVADYSSDED